MHVLITGASRGLGRALATTFAGSGARLSLCARHAGALEAVVAGLPGATEPPLARTVDVRDARAVEGWVAAAVQAHGPPTALINNASRLGPRVPLREHPVEAWREVLDVNLTGAFLVCRAVLPHMLAAGSGSIINVSSGAAIPPRVDWGAYAVSKHALEGFSLNLAEELRDAGVRVNLVDPGAMRTEMRAEAYPAEDPDTVKPARAAAPVFLWLAGPSSREVTGQRFRADEWEAPER